MNIADVITEGARILAQFGVTDERLTAGLLLSHLLEMDRARLLIHSKDHLSTGQYERYLHLVKRRARGEPLQYITGRQEFYHLDFIVTPDVLIPRPETEFLVERVLALARKTCGKTFIADIGTGSGCIATTLAVNLPLASFVATDISAAALAVARRNAERHKVDERIEFFEGDLLTPLATGQLAAQVDIIASNPPYVPSAMSGALQREVQEWEPHVALFGGCQGLDLYHRLLEDSPTYLKSGGYLVCEIGYQQLDALRTMIASSAFELREVTEDLQSIPRILTLQKK